MADDLDDEWWEKGSDGEKGNDEDGNKSGEASSSDKESNDEDTSCAVKLTIKPADTDENNESPRKRQMESEEQIEQPVKKKRKRKKISEILANEKPAPLFPHDLTQSIEKHFKGKLSPVEWDDIKIEEEHFTTCNDGTHTPTSYLRFILPKWKKLVSKMDDTPGSPLVLLICSSGIRAANLSREFRTFSDGVRVSKLFAKHIKLKEQVEFLKAKIIHIGIGTPNRLQALLDCGALNLDQLKYAVVDWSFRDVKFRRIGDIVEIRQDLFQLFTKNLLPLVKKSKQSKFALL